MDTSANRSTATVHEISFPTSGCAAIEIALIEGAREVECSIGSHGIDRFDDHSSVGRRVNACGLPVLEWSLLEVNKVVDNNVASCRPQVANVLRKVRDAPISCCEEEFCSRSQIVDDFEHPGSFVAGSRLPGKNRDLTKITGEL